MTVAGGYLYFAATINGSRILYRTDGSNVGTVPVRRSTGTSTASLFSPDSLVAVDNVLYVVASTSTAVGAPRLLWRVSNPASPSDTTASAVEVKEDGTQVFDPQQLTVAGSRDNLRLYFTYGKDSIGRELYYVNDATSATPTATLLADVTPRNDAPSQIGNLTNVNGRLFFTSNYSVTGPQLWMANSTGTNAIPVPKTTSNAPASFVGNFAVLGSKLFYVANVNSAGGPLELWTAEVSGTKRLLDNLGASMFVHVFASEGDSEITFSDVNEQEVLSIPPKVNSIVNRQGLLSFNLTDQIRDAIKGGKTHLTLRLNTPNPNIQFEVAGSLVEGRTYQGMPCLARANVVAHRCGLDRPSSL